MIKEEKVVENTDIKKAKTKYDALVKEIEEEDKKVDEKIASYKSTGKTLVGIQDSELKVRHHGKIKR